MAKRQEYRHIAFITTLFIFLFPVLVSGFDKKAVIFASLSLFLVVGAYEALNKGFLVVSKPFLLMALISVYSFVSLLYVTDKGEHMLMCAFLLLCSILTVIPVYIKLTINEDLFEKMVEEALYKSGTIYSICVILWQVFIDSKFLSSMNLGGGSNSATAIVAFLGICAWINLCKKGKRDISFFVTLIPMLYSFVMARSLVCYLMAAIIVLFVSLNMRHKKLEAFIALVVSVVLGVINLIYAVALFVVSNVGLSSALMGVSKVFGVGVGGWKAVNQIVNSVEIVYPNTFFFMAESFGVFGIAFVVAIVLGAFRVMGTNKSTSSMIMLVVLTASLFSNIQTFMVLFPLCCLYYGVTCKAASVNIKPFYTYVTAPVAMLFALLFVARIPFAMGNHLSDTLAFKNAESCYSMGARLSLFDSEGWEKAYESAVAGNSGGTLEREYLKNATRFNKKNYEYKKLMADSYTKEGNYEVALSLWEEIMEKYDDEVLYESYAEKIMTVMSTMPDGNRMEQLYNRISAYADKAEDKDVKFKVNNILAKSQAFYVASLEGGVEAGDMYQSVTTTVEEATEYESGSAES